MGFVRRTEQGGYILWIQITLPNTLVPCKQRSRQRRDSAYIFILQWHSNYNSCH